MEGKPALRILAETAYPLTVASARVRVAGFAPHLLAHQVDLGYAPALTDDEYRLLLSEAAAGRKALTLALSGTRAAVRRRPQHDLLLVHRLRLLSPLPGFDPPRRLDVYDLDDALFLGSTATVNRRFSWAKQEARRAIECMRRARLVIAGNAFLADRARQYSRCVEVVPSCVDPALQAQRVHGEHAPVTVGWIGSRSTSEYLLPVLDVFANLNARSTRAKLVLVGAAPLPRAPWLEQRPWVLANEGRDLASFDIGIMPLPDTDWARGKCGYKVLQYFAAGVPAVASPVGVTPALIGAERGRVADSATEWQRALTELIDDVDERREQGAAARTYVEAHYSYQRWSRELASMLRSVSA